MPTFEIRNNGSPIGSTNGPGENIRIKGPRLVGSTDAHGVLVAAPDHIDVILQRDLPEGQGDLLLCRIATESQVWNNHDQYENLWPEGTVVFDKKRGNRTTPVQQSTLKRMFVTRWKLHWEGRGPQKLSGADFTEQLHMQALELTKTCLKQNVSVIVKLAQ